MTQSTVEYTYTLGFKNPEFEAYQDLRNEEEIISAVREEVRKSIVDLGSDGYDPGAMFPMFGVTYDADTDPEGDLWGAAAEFAVQVATQRELMYVLRDMVNPVLAGEVVQAEYRIPGDVNIFLKEDWER